MEINVKPTDELTGEVSCPASKSYTIRSVLAALLADGVSTIKKPLMSRDTKAVFNACESFGGKIKHKGDQLDITGVGGNIKAPKNPIDTLNSGTTIRICTAIASLCNEKITLTGDGSIQSRPIQPLLDALGQMGVKTSSTNGCPPISIQGPLNGGHCDIAGNVSSQYISGLLMAAPYASNDTSLKITTEMKSTPYVAMTLQMLKRFGIDVSNQDYRRFKILSDQTYKPTSYTVEGDYSSSAFIVAASALTKSKVTINNLLYDSLQADKMILDIVDEMGAKVKIESDSVTISSDGNLTGIEVDLSQAPDLVPIVSTLGALSGGTTRIYNAEHARIKECNRISAMVTELSKMGADIKEEQDGMIIKSSTLKGTVVDGWKDHRIIMSLAIAGLKARGSTKITGAEHIDVTFPGFVEAMKGIGAGII